MCGIVICYLSNREILCPSCWRVTGVDTEVLLECAIRSFCLSICLGVIGGGERQGSGADSEQLTPEVGSEAEIAVGHNAS